MFLNNDTFGTCPLGCALCIAEAIEGVWRDAAWPVSVHARRVARRELLNVEPWERPVARRGSGECTRATA